MFFIRVALTAGLGLLLLASCAPGEQPEDFGRPTHEVTASIPRSTREITPSTNPFESLPRTSATPQETEVPRLEALEVGLSFLPDDEILITAGWDDTDEEIYLASARHEGDQPLNWWSYDLSSGQADLVSSSPMLDYHFTNYGLHTDYQGRISPSRRYEFILTSAAETGEGSARESVLWMLDSQTGQRTQLALVGFDRFLHADWSVDESIAAVRLGYEGPPRVLIVETRSRSASWLSQRADYFDFVEGEFALAPTGRILAVSEPYENGGRIALVNLDGQETTRVDALAYVLRWDDEGDSLFYWSVPDYPALELTAFVEYSLDEEQSKEVFSAHEIAQLDGCGIACYFDVSHGGDRILFWIYDRAWVVKLRE